jgi:hypothetical protein
MLRADGLQAQAAGERGGRGRFKKVPLLFHYFATGVLRMAG